MAAGPRWYRVAGLTLRLDGDVAAEDAPLFEERWGPFCVDAPLRAVRPDLHIETEGTPGYFNRKVAEDPTGDSPFVQRDGRWTVHRIDYEGEFVAPSHLRARTDGTVGALNGLLRHLLVDALLERGGLLLHAAAIRAASRIAVIAGPSGAGKTTACRHAPRGCEVLGDEQAVLLPQAGSFWVYGTPIVGELARPGRPDGGRVTAIDFISHAARNERTPLDAHQAMRRLLAVTVFYPRDPSINLRAVDACAAFVRDVPAFDLAALGDGSFWPLVLPPGEIA